MAYCTQDDIEILIPEEELAELTTESGSIPDAEVVAEAIAKADAEIDSYLAVKYAVPFADVPDRVKSLSVYMAIYHLYTRRSVVPQLREQNYQGAVRFLHSVVRGEAVVLAGGKEVGGSATSGQVVEIESAQRVFNRETMTDW